MINSIPLLGWFISFFVSASASVPFWFIWTKCELGRLYFYWLPEVYLSIPFWHCVGLCMVIPILKTVLVPSLVNVTQNKD